MKNNILKYNTVDFSTVYIGKTTDIKAMYKSMARASQKGWVTNLGATFSGIPKFSEKKEFYGIIIDSDGWFQIITCDAFFSMLYAGEIA